MNNPVCISTTCPVTDDVASYLGSYNIQASVPYSNSLVSNVPVGDGFYISVPPGTFNVTVTPNTSSFTLQTISIPCPDGEVAETGCNLSYSYPIPAGATSAQIQQILDNATQQVAVIKGRCCIGFPPQPVQTWTNTPQSASCDGYGGLKVVGTLPGYATVSFTQVTINAGVFVSTISQADADNQASDAAVQLIDSAIIECGWWNMQQTCTGGGTVAANLYFSTVSQADANAQALAGGCGGCPDWTQIAWGPESSCNGATSGNGVSSFNATGTALETFNFFGSTQDATGTVVINHLDCGGGDDGTGYLTYNTTSPCSCNIKLVATSTGNLVTNGQNFIGIVIMVNGCPNEIIEVPFLAQDGQNDGGSGSFDYCDTVTPIPATNNCNGTFNFPFTLPSTGGVPATISVVFGFYFGIFGGGNNTPQSVSGSVLITNI